MNTTCDSLAMPDATHLPNASGLPRSDVPGDDNWPAEGVRPAQPFDLWTRVNVEEVWPDPVSPLTWSSIPHLHNASFRALFHGAHIPRLEDLQIVGRFYGRIYFNEGALLHVMCDQLGLPASFVDTGLGRLRSAGRFAQQGVRPARFVRHLPSLVRLAKARAGADRKLAALFPQIDAWTAEFRERKLPELEQASDRDVWAAVSVWTQRFAQTLDRHNAASTAAMQAYTQLAGVLTRWTGRQDLSHDLVTGLSGVYAAEMGAALWDLARTIGDRGLAGVVLDGNPAAALALLRGSPAARPAVESLDAFLRRFGHRCPNEPEWRYPRWAEAPEQIVEVVAGYLRAGEQANPVAATARSRRRREDATAAVASHLGPLRRAIFRRLLANAQRGVRLRDNGRHYVMKAALPLRQLYAALGERWAGRGWLRRPEDIFFLALPEIEAVIAAGAPAAAGLDLPALVGERRRAYDCWFGVEPPEVIGPDGRPVDDLATVSSAAPVAPPVAPAATILEGIAASGGRSRGVARIVERLGEAARLRPGDILVTHATDPGWTPVFPLVVGLVLESGGQLSHGAIVAREYGVPAVVGVRDATRRIRDGQTIIVDGTAGRVTLEGRQAPPAAQT